MDQSTAAHIRCEVDARGVARVTLARPEKHNAFDDAMIASMQSHFAALSERDDLRVVVLQAEGKSFSAGADLAWMQRMADFDYGHNFDDAHALATMLHTLKNIPHPTIARVQGNVLGGAVGLVSCCDIAIASRSARFGLTETRIGLIPATISPYVVEAIGARWAGRLFLTAERFDVSLAEKIHLVHESCEDGELDQRVATIVDGLLDNGPEALRAAKALIPAVAGKDIDEQLIDDTSARIAHTRVSSEGQEGLRAFLEKRAPNWHRGVTADV